MHLTCKNIKSNDSDIYGEKKTIYLNFCEKFHSLKDKNDRFILINLRNMDLFSIWISGAWGIWMILDHFSKILSCINSYLFKIMCHNSFFFFHFVYKFDSFFFISFILFNISRDHILYLFKLTCYIFCHPFTIFWLVNSL